MPQPTATVVIPCFNHGRFVGEAVASALRQESADVRVVVVDDGSDDGTTPAACDACASERVTVVRQENRGLPAARNRGAAGAASEYLVFLDADDWLEPGFVARLAETIEAEGVSRGGGEQAGSNPSASPAHLFSPSPAQSISHAYCQERLVENGVSTLWRVPDWDPLLMMITNLHPVTALVKRRCFEAVGGFDETMRHGYEDWDLWLKFVERGWRGVRVREPLFVWRRHSDSTMVMNAVKDHAALYDRIRQRHRALYDRHALDLVVRSNALLRRFEMNWIDEDGRPINLCALAGQREMYESMVAVRAGRLMNRLLRKKP